MPDQHTKEYDKGKALEEGILIPLDLPEFQVVSQTWHHDGSVSVRVIAKQQTAICPQCQVSCDRIHDRRDRVKRDLMVRTSRVNLIVIKRRFRCSTCLHTFTEPDKACGRRRRTTRRLRETLGKHAMTQPVEQVADTFAVGPRFVRECLHHLSTPLLQARGLDEHALGPLPTPRFLGIDEFAVRKGHRYATILCNLEQREVMEVCLGRKLDDVVALLNRLEHPENVQAVSMDMSASFAPAVRKALPQVQIVVDHFHVIGHLMKAFRKVVSSWAHKKEGCILLHRKQHLFLCAKEDLTAEQEHERARIATHLPALAHAWELKEALRTWYAQATMKTAEAQLDAWIIQVRETGPEPMRQALSTFVNWKAEILAFFRFLPNRLTNGFVEDKNNRTKAMMRQAYGYRNFRNLRVRILLGGTV
ncbi:ISL3 family transposase [Dictyobacter vulcani]|uniref:ISL3 family transposase n=1 Tax=Dictyobacter vulcani TaxID=2607529 RepID=A0A5J4KJC8_9CHLR|nr:ISL3 family transposase [Dictyobacter vulcani]GER86261.1 ISL3 family transposase [Dictyobacter vulcani]